ncbi:hypothetical protein Q604_UNBC02466G0001, partial [human gut metagenome]
RGSTARRGSTTGSPNLDLIPGSTAGRRGLRRPDLNAPQTVLARHEPAPTIRRDRYSRKQTRFCRNLRDYLSRQGKVRRARTTQP